MGGVGVRVHIYIGMQFPKAYRSMASCSFFPKSAYKF